MPGGQPGDVDLLRRRVLNVVGHELRTPVTTLVGLADELAARSADDELAAAVARNARRLDRLVSDLLLAAAVGNVVPVADPAPTDLVAALRSAWSRRGIDADLAVEGEATGVARQEVLDKVLDVLVDNAAVHGEPPYRATASVEGDRAVLELANGGPALPEEDLALAVEAFYRSERGVTDAPGLGLGLAIANTLVTADGGTLSLRSDGAEGVVARLELPSA